MKKLIDNDVLSTKTEHVVDPDDPSWNYVNNSVEIAPKLIDTDDLRWSAITLTQKDNGLDEYGDAVGSLCIEMPFEQMDDMSKELLFKSTKDNSGARFEIANNRLTLIGWDNEWNQTEYYEWRADEAPFTKTGKLSSGSIPSFDVEFTNWIYKQHLKVHLTLTDSNEKVAYSGSGIIYCYNAVSKGTDSNGVIRIPVSTTECSDVIFYASFYTSSDKYYMQIHFVLQGVTIPSNVTNYRIEICPAD